MIIDSDDEQPGSQQHQFKDEPEFADEGERTDSAKAYPNIVQHLDLDLGAAGLHLAVPHFLTSTVESAPITGPAILNDQIIFAVACSDHTIRVISRPLVPPTPESKLRSDVQSKITSGKAGTGKWGEAIVDLVAGSLPSDGVSLTFTAIASDNALLTGEESDQRSSKSRGDNWHIIVASHSRTGPGQLLIHRVPILGKTHDGKLTYSLSRDHNRPQQNIPLSSPVTGISFHPNISSPHYSTRLLVSDRHGACRIYDCGPSITSASDAADSAGIGTQHGSWLLTLYSGFHQEKVDTSNLVANYTGITGRKPIVDCKWVMGGKAVIALLGDAEWGIWDIEGAMHSGIKGILGRQSIRGGAITAFTVSGWIDGPITKSGSGKGSIASSSTSKFAPMTPGTRKTADPVLFGGKSGLSSIRGQISVTRLPPTSTTTLAEECVTFWLEDSYNVIPSLRAYLEGQARRANGGSGNLFGAGNTMGRLVRLEGVNLRGERCCGIDSFPRLTLSKVPLPADIILLAEHRYIILSDNTPEQSSLRRRIPSQTSYQALRTKELDVAEIDQVLSRMENSSLHSYTESKLGFHS